MDQAPEPSDQVFADLARETSDNLGVSVLFGSAQNGWGVRRLLKALRHEAPGPEATAARLGVAPPSTSSRSTMAARSAGWRWPACSADDRRGQRPQAAATSTRGWAPCSRSRATRRQGQRGRRRRHRRGGQGRRASRAANGSAPASCRRRSRSTIPRAIARWRSSRRPQGRRQAVGRAGAADRGRCRLIARAGRGQPRDAAARGQRRASQHGARQAEAPLRGRGEAHPAVDRLSRIDPQPGAPAAATRSSPAATASSAT